MRRRRVVLLVHPDEHARVRYQVVLKREGYVVLEAADLGAALAALHESPPELVITAMKLPRSSGAELIRTLRTDYDMPVLALGNDADRADALASGAAEFEAVPLGADQLVKTVIRLIGRA